MYNSQDAGYGIAGYGVTIKGLSAITRGEKNLFKDNGVIAGVKYTEDDNLFLDGKRLVLISGSAFQEGTTYCPEGDPFTTIIVHGTYSDTSSNTWFEVKTTDGKTYQYGNNANARISFQSTDNKPRIASWHINRIDDCYGNYILFTYIISGLYAYPATISYGLNSVKARGISNQIIFGYEALDTAPANFRIEGKPGLIDRRLATITTSSNDIIYRKYRLRYNTSSDQGPCKFARLTEITEENGAGESLPPTVLSWSYLPAGNVNATALSIPTTDPNSAVEDLNKLFFAADLNGDGISDIIRISQVNITEIIGNQTIITTEGRAYINRSQISPTGEVTYSDALVLRLPPSFNLPKMSSSMGGAALLDFDGDGYNDLLIPYTDNLNSLGSQEALYIIKGSEIAEGGAIMSYGYGVSLSTSVTEPLLVTFDTDKDGKDDILCVENTLQNGLYSATLIKNKTDGANMEIERTAMSFSLPAQPQKLFCGDFNNDGLTDIIFLHKNGYKIYFNKGGSKNDLKFTESDTRSGTTISDQWRYQQGDFDGDGLIDFVYNVAEESYLRIAHNNGDGTFSLIKTDDIGISGSRPRTDDSHFSIVAYDINRDGRSDVMVCKAQYTPQGLKYSETKAIWMLSNGNTLTIDKNITKTREEDANERYIFLGDFDGDGHIELANYGACLSQNLGGFQENKIYLYPNNSYQAKTGRVTGITDGMGNKTSIEYAYTTSPEVYTKTNTGTNSTDVNTITLPIPVVKKISTTNGVAGQVEVGYHYRNFMVHTTGGGPLGFSEVCKNNITLGKKTTSIVVEWDQNHWIPMTTLAIDSVAGKQSTETVISSYATVNNTFFAHEIQSCAVDYYGNQVKTITRYNPTTGALMEQSAYNNGTAMYKQAVYSDYNFIAGRWLPGLMILAQKHEDDSNGYAVQTNYTYDAFGNTIKTVKNFGSQAPLTLTSTYDTYGNPTSSVCSGTGVKSIVKYNEYDPSGRFVIKSYQSPAAEVSTFSYDMWGNLLTACDSTDPTNILTTTHTYDNWGRLRTTTTPDGTTTTQKTGWGSTDKRKYYILKTTSDNPWELTWYDKAGHETSHQTFGPKNINIQKSSSYNSRGQISSIHQTYGKLAFLETFTYDDFGRISTHSYNSGKKISYKYDNRTTTTSCNGQTSIKIVDAWGNPVKSIDSEQGEVIYKYNSNGQPSSITSNGSKITFTYNSSGYRTSMSDPDAGTTLYEYAADGTLLKQTNANGDITSNSYDDLGRPVKVKIGNTVVENQYGTSGNDKLRLKKKISGSDFIEYSYDDLGRIISEEHYIADKGSFVFTSVFDSKNRLAKTTYPGGLEVEYEYDDYGFRIGTIADSKSVYKLKEYDGRYFESAVLDSLVYIREWDKYGYESYRELISNKNRLSDVPEFPGILSADQYLTNKTLDKIYTSFDPLTSNLQTRKRRGYSEEIYEYDNLDRLISVSTDDEELMSVSYAANGNILYKTGPGNYTYNPGAKPHAVIAVDNPDGAVSTNTLLTTFNEFGKISSIVDEQSGEKLYYSYGPDLECTYTTHKWNRITKSTHIYLGNYERINEFLNDTREYYYLDDNIIIIKENNKFTPYVAFTDHLGSILSVFNGDSKNVFDATYDAWGMQTIKTNEIKLTRGYTGHEMLPDFGLINMKGRVYDPALGRFLSPDNFVQLPDFTQSFNRYSYCLNNPMKYTDPSGELFGIDDAIFAFAAFNMAGSMMRAAVNGENIWKAGGLSLLSSAAAFGIGQALGGIGNIGKELVRAGAHGISGGLLSMLGGGNFGSGILAGALSSGLGSFMNGLHLSPSLCLVSSAAIGGTASWLIGSDFVSGALQGLMIGFFNHTYHVLPKEVTYYQYSDGSIRADLPELVISEEKPIGAAYATAQFTHSVISNAGSSLKKHSGNSTVGRKKIYFKNKNQRPFYGNQYVKTKFLRDIGRSIGKYTIWGSAVFWGTDLYYSYQADKAVEALYGYTDYYFMKRTAAGIVGSCVLGSLCFNAGAGLCGIVSVPCGIIGGTIMGVLGGMEGQELGEQIFDEYYYNTNY